MRVRIRKEHVESAVRKNAHHCMIAEAIREEIPNATAVLVDLQSIRWSDPNSGVRYFYLTPPEAQQALLRFDEGQPVAPFNIELRRPAMIRPVAYRPQGPAAPKAVQRRQVKVAPANRMVRRVQSAEREFGVRKLKDIVIHGEGEERV